MFMSPVDSLVKFKDNIKFEEMVNLHYSLMKFISVRSDIKQYSKIQNEGCIFRIQGSVM